VGHEGVVVRRLAAVKGTDEEVEVVALWSAAMTANRSTRRNRALRSRLLEGSAGSARRFEVGLHGGSLAQFRGAVDREKGRESSYDPRPMSRVSAFVRASALAVASLAILAGCQGRPMVAAKKEADFAFEHGDYAKAAPAYLEIIEKAPGDWEVEYRYGVCLAELGNLREARTHVETAQAANPKSEEVAAGLAQVYFKLGEKQKLVQLLQDRGNLQRSLPSFMLLADYALQMNDADTATTAVNGAILLADGKDFEPYLKAVEVAEKLGDTKTASRRLRQAYAINPKSPAVGAKLAEYGLAAEPTTGLPPGP
jgi:tetratricopeptide (TPR) repeat protein